MINVSNLARWYFPILAGVYLATKKWLPHYAHEVVGVGLISMGLIELVCILNRNWGNIDKISFCGSMSLVGNTGRKYFLFWGIGLIFVGFGFFLPLAFFPGVISLVIFGGFYFRRFFSKSTVGSENVDR